MTFTELEIVAGLLLLALALLQGKAIRKLQAENERLRAEIRARILDMRAHQPFLTGQGRRRW